jgi:WD40 repeat protein
LNKVRWSKDGTKLVVGDAVGKIKIYNINKKILEISDE